MQTQSHNEKKKMKVMVIGLDGATFDILNPLISRGKLSHLQYLIREGVSGVLKSTIPPSSPPAWSTFQTGKDPGKHGIFDFFRNSPEDYVYTPVNATSLKTKTLWEILSDHGRRVGVINFLFTYPPKRVNGFIVSGKETPGEDSEYTFPGSLKKEILQIEPSYEAVPFKRISPTKKFLSEVPIHLNRQERINQYLLNKYPTDLFINLFPMPDIIQHIFWKFMDPTHPYYSEKESRNFLPLIEKCYQTLDTIVGRRINNINEDTVVIVMSDHGAGALHKIIQLNKWLQDQGLLVVKQGYKGKRTLFLVMLKNMIKKLDNYIARYDYTGLRRRIKSKTMEKRRAFAKRSIVDWSMTKAYAGRLGEQGIYCNLMGREKHGIVLAGEEYDEVRNFIISKLSELRDPHSGQKIFNRIYKREELYKGPYMSYAPDIILDFGDSPYQTGDDLLSRELFTNIKKNGVSGKHRKDGILIVYGKHIKKGTKIHESCISDLAPTILHLMGEKIPRDMDGEVLLEIFEPSFLQMHPVAYDDAGLSITPLTESEVTYSEEETESIKDRLKPLGYL